MYCKYCGEKIDDDSLFCKKCGQPQNNPQLIDDLYINKIKIKINRPWKYSGSSSPMKIYIDEKYVGVLKNNSTFETEVLAAECHKMYAVANGMGAIMTYPIGNGMNIGYASSSSTLNSNVVEIGPNEKEVEYKAYFKSGVIILEKVNNNK